MKLAIMQPYFLPYLGYFQLINAVDEFVIYDDIEYTKKGWINRNRLLSCQGEMLVTLPLKKGSDYLKVNQRYLADSWVKDRVKLNNRIRNWYIKAPYFESIEPIINQILFAPCVNLFDFIYNSLIHLLRYLQIQTPLIRSSTLDFDSSLKGEGKVLAICELQSASEYLNPQGGVELYDKASFTRCGVDLQFLNCLPYEYEQFSPPFTPFLSIVDVLMFNDLATVKLMLNEQYSIK
ncbi:WbqC family protein [Agarivorans sp. DSG3-1]|uniref:WbqC family protein n=1 Tax=Agarivorans sp. DSG3-1 TaxID=3342249 RepID=UPI00398F7B2A